MTAVLPWFCAGQESPYRQIMKDCLVSLDSASSFSELMQTANGFEIICNSEPTEWLPAYYCAYCYIQMSYKAEDSGFRDELLETARKYIEKSDILSPGNPEITVLKGFRLQAYMNIEPLSRGMRYNNECIAYFKNAAAIDPYNPRAYLWHSVQLLNIPSFMGGGKDKALPLLEKALVCFRNFIPGDELQPDWGYNFALKKYSVLTSEE